MARRHFFMGALAGTTLACCGAEPADFRVAGSTQAQSAIVGGAACDPDEYPETGLVSRLDGAVCTGTLIAPDTVLTAAHCVLPMVQLSKAFLPPKLFAFTPEDGRHSGTAPVQVRDYAVHPDYRSAEFCTSPRSADEQRACRHVWNECGESEDLVAYRQCIAQLPRDVRTVIGAVGPGRANDVALLFLSAPVAHASTAQLLPPSKTHDIKQRRHVDIVGYGINTAFPDATLHDADPVKRWGSTTIITVGAYELLTAAAPSAHACHGDSGGPLMLQGPDARRTQIGVASRIDDWHPDTGCVSGLLYSRVDTHLPWILETMAVACDDGARVSCEMPQVAGYEFADDDDNRQGCAITSAGLWVAVAVGLLLLKMRRQL